MKRDPLDLTDYELDTIRQVAWAWRSALGMFDIIAGIANKGMSKDDKWRGYDEGGGYSSLGWVRVPPALIAGLLKRIRILRARQHSANCELFPP